MQLGPTEIIDTFAEAFRVRFARLVITAEDEYWVTLAAQEFSGYGASMIGCDAEVGVEAHLDPSTTPDGRPGVAVLAFAFSAAALKTALPNRVGQCVMTCPTTAVYDGQQSGEETVPLGRHLRFFGDGYQKSKQILDERLWRIPVMDGEFLVTDTVVVAKGVAGGNLILQGESQRCALSAARRASDAVAAHAGVIAPFPGGVVRSGSKVGSRYKGLVASTADAYCPTLRGRCDSELREAANCAYEIVIDGVDEGAVRAAMTAAVRAAVGDGVIAIGAGNYGGKLGKFQFHLHDLLSAG